MTLRRRTFRGKLRPAEMDSAMSSQGHVVLLYLLLSSPTPPVWPGYSLTAHRDLDDRRRSHPTHGR
jgi:hypothetical protein